LRRIARQGLRNATSVALRQSKRKERVTSEEVAMDARTTVRCVCAILLAWSLLAGLTGCDALSRPPVPDWPGPHAPYPFPDDVPHRTE